MAGYFKGGFGRLRSGVGGEIRLRASLAPPIVEAPVTGGFFVSPSGNDAANGSLASPFATIGRALTATRAGTEKQIFLRDGSHYLTSKISLGVSDKGTSFKSYPGEVAVISGGIRLTGFADEGDGLYSKVLAQPSGLDLFVGGVRQRPSQTGGYSPDNPYRSGWLVADASVPASSSKLRFPQGSIPNGLDSPSVMIHVFDAKRRVDFITYVTGIDYGTREITLLDPHPSGNIGAGATFRILNHPALIGRDEEFAWRVQDSKIVLRPSSSGFEAQGVVLPLLDGLIDIQNGADDVTFIGITFSDSNFHGYAISITNSHRFRAGNCTFRNVGDGVRVTAGTDGAVGGCTFIDLANNGVLLNQGSDNWKVYSNRFIRVGRIKKGAAALFGQGGEATTFAFNEVQFSPRYGVTFKGGGGSHRVIYNTIKDTANETADSAAIEFSGGSVTDLSSLVEGNMIDRTPGYPDRITGEFSEEFNDIEFNISTNSPRAKSASIYLNDAASGVTVRGNVTRGASVGHFIIDGGDRNTIENNISILDEFDSHYGVIQATNLDSL